VLTRILRFLDNRRLRLTVRLKLHCLIEPLASVVLNWLIRTNRWLSAPRARILVLILTARGDANRPSLQSAITESILTGGRKLLELVTHTPAMLYHGQDEEVD